MTLNDTGSTFNDGGFGYAIREVAVASGNDQIISLDGSRVLGDIMLVDGADALTLKGASFSMIGRILMGADNDTVTFDAASTAGVSLLDGGTGFDMLNLNNTLKDGGADIVNWETVNLLNGSTLSLKSNLVLGDAETGTGSLSIDPSSVLNGGGGVNPTILPVSAGQNVTVTNAGLIDLVAGSSGPGNTLTIVGNYVGQGGTLLIATVLGDDMSPTDRLAIDTGHASGSTLLNVINKGGGGALTVGAGILVVQALNGATTDAGSFVLSGRVAAGAYEYNLYQGGGSDVQGWYLRSTLISDDTTPPGTPVPNYRQEVAVDMVVPSLAMEYGYAMLDNLQEHLNKPYERQLTPLTEDREVVCDDPKRKVRCVVHTQVPENGRTQERWFSGAWGRALGGGGAQNRNNFFRYGADYDYTITGLQAGLDIWGQVRSDGAWDKAGLYVGLGRISADVRGLFDHRAGSVEMDAYSLGGYWAHHSASGWYVGTILQATFYKTEARSDLGQRITPDSWSGIASVEGGYVMTFADGYTLEPQAQLAYQRITTNSARDEFGIASFDDGNSLRGRLGARLTKNWKLGELHRPRVIAAWLRANVWHEFLDGPRMTMASLSGRNSVEFTSSLGGTWGEIGVGVSGDVSEQTSLFAAASYSRSLDNKGREAWDGRVGLNLRW